MLAGAFVAILPFLGFPTSWDKVLLFITGVCVIVLGIIVRRRSDVGAPHEESASSEVEPRI